MPIDITTIEGLRTALQPQRLAPYTVSQLSCSTATEKGGRSPLSIRSNIEFSTWPTAQAVHKSAIGNAKVSNMPDNLFDSGSSILATYSVSHKMHNEGAKIFSKGIKKTQRLINSGKKHQSIASSVLKDGSNPALKGGVLERSIAAQIG